MGNDLLEDGLYAMEDKLKDPAFEDKMVRFVRASMKGWEYALDNPDEAAGIVVDNGGQDENHQKHMMGEVAKLIDNADGKLDRGGLSSAPPRRCSTRRSSPRSRQAPGRTAITDKAIK